MKALLACAAGAGLVAALGVAGPALAQSSPPAAPPQPAPAPPAAKTDASKGTAAASDAKKPAKPEPVPKIPGITIPRAKGGYLGIVVEEGYFKLSFYDAKKKPAKADVARAMARWPVHYKVGDERTVLNPNDDGTALTSSKFVRPPYTFKLYLSLLAEGSENAVESYVIDFRQ